MKKYAVGALLTTVLAPLAGSCNSDDVSTVVLPSSALVRSVSLAENDAILPNLDSVYFSIDLYTGQIYNADSLPYGTKVKALQPVIVTDGASVLELSVPRAGKVDTVYNYLENTSDTIDFSNGPVKLRIVSLDGKTERNYTFRVNVHTQPTDTLKWSRLERAGLPSAFPVVNGQHTTMSPSGKYYCVTTYEGQYSMAVADDPSGKWNISKCVFGFEPDINSMTATTKALYIMDKTGKLYTSSDDGASWTATGTRADYVLGAYTNRLITTVKSGTSWSIVEYPGGRSTAAPAGFPVMNPSTAVALKFDMSEVEQLIVVGGRTANGHLTNHTWGFDGTTWVDITKRGLPYDLENMSLVPYFDIVPDTASWRVSTRTSIMLAMFGNRSDGTPNDTVYMSPDFGMHWTKAPGNLQIDKKVVPSRTKAQAYLHTSTLNATKSHARRVPDVRYYIPVWTDLGYGRRFGAPASRVSAPVEEWEVPFIFLFGGTNAEGSTYNTLFRGAITAFTYKPLR